MNIREAIYKAGEFGQIRLKNKVFKIPSFNGEISLSGEYEGYVFSIPELISLDWEAKSTEWKSDVNE